jgi:hypothetical protein
MLAGHLNIILSLIVKTCPLRILFNQYIIHYILSTMVHSESNKLYQILVLVQPHILSQMRLMLTLNEFNYLGHEHNI